MDDVEPQAGLEQGGPGGGRFDLALGDRGTSCQPVNRFSWFHVLSPWRTMTSVDGMVAQITGGPGFVVRSMLLLGHSTSIVVVDSYPSSLP